MKRTLCFLMITALLLFLCACGKQGPASAGSQGRGRYMESRVTLPLPQGAPDQYLIGMYPVEGGMEYVTYYGEEDGQDSWRCSYYRHTVLGDSVTTTDVEWLNAAAPTGGNQMMLTRCGETLYFTFGDYDEEGKPQNHIFVSRDNGVSGEALTGNGVGALSMIISIAPFEDGSMAVQDMDGAILLLDAEGNLTEQLGAGNYNGGLAATGSKLAYFAPSGSAVRVYDLKTKEETEWPMDVPQSAVSQMRFLEDGTLYLAAPTGLYSHAPNGTLWENFVDGDASNLGIPSYYLSAMALEAGERPVVYVADYEANVYRYAYDPEAYQSASIELDVFSMEENYMVRQAVVSFNRQRSDVKVNYTVASSLAGGGSPQDYIKALNTELLAGNGPDVLILDGLPLDSYIEKGVLAQIGPVVAEAEAILPNVSQAYQRDGALYAIPLGISLPAVLTRDAHTDFSSLDALAAAAEAQTGAPLLSPVGYSYETLPRMLLQNYGDGLRAGDPAAATAFLTDAGRVAKAIGSSEILGEGLEVLFGIPLADVRAILLDAPFYPQIRAFALGEANAAVFEIRSLADSDCMIAAGAAEEYGGTLQGIGGRFYPVGLAGLNRASEHPETAQEFLRALLSQDVQRTDAFNSACFPVNLAALQELFQQENSNFSTSVNLDETRSITGLWPSAAMREAILGLVEGANTAAASDDALSSMLLPEITAYLEGESTLEAAGEKIGSVLSTYLSE